MVIFAVLILNFSAMLTPYLPINVNDVFSWSIYYLIGSYLGIHWKEAVSPKKPYIPALIFLMVHVLALYLLLYTFKQVGSIFTKYVVLRFSGT